MENKQEREAVFLGQGLACGSCLWVGTRRGGGVRARVCVCVCVCVCVRAFWESGLRPEPRSLPVVRISTPQKTEHSAEDRCKVLRMCFSQTELV